MRRIPIRIRGHDRPHTFLAQFQHVRGLRLTHQPRLRRRIRGRRARDRVRLQGRQPARPHRLREHRQLRDLLGRLQRPPRHDRGRPTQLRKMIRRRTRPRPFPITGLIHPRCQQRLRARGQPLDPIERRPHLGHVPQQHICRIEPTHHPRDRARSDPHRRRRHAHLLLDHRRPHSSTMTDGCDSYVGADQMS